MTGQRVRVMVYSTDEPRHFMRTRWGERRGFAVIFRGRCLHVAWLP